MIRVVIDTNVVVSATLNDKGPSAAILDLAANQRILMFASPPVLAEYEEVLRRPRFKVDSARIESAMALIRNTSKLVSSSYFGNPVVLQRHVYEPGRGQELGLCYPSAEPSGGRSERLAVAPELPWRQALSGSGGRHYSAD